MARRRPKECEITTSPPGDRGRLCDFRRNMGLWILTEGGSER